MENLSQDARRKRRLLIILLIAAGIVLALVAVLVLLKPFGQRLAYVPGKIPNGVEFAQIASGDELSDQERYDAYGDDNDPAHPVLDVPVSLSISNLGSRPGTPREQDLESEYPSPTAQPAVSPTPAPTPAATIRPGIVIPGVKPGADLPSINLPDLYILEPDVVDPQFTGREYTLAWEYTAGRDVVFAVSLSDDGGKTFLELATGLKAKNYTLTFPDSPAKHCVLRVTALLEGRVYKTADTEEFALVAAPAPAPVPIVDYVDPQVQYVDIPGIRISSALSKTVWFNAKNNADNADKLVWQLSKSPFWGTKESFGKEEGIIANGEIAKSGGEFSIDLAALCEQLTKEGAAKNAEEPFLIPQSVYEFYLRVVALDSAGNCIGDPGRGLDFSYGLPDVTPDSAAATMAENPKIQVQVYVPYYWEHRWERISPDVLDRDIGDDSDFMLFVGTDGPYEEGLASVVSGIEDATDTAADVIEDVINGEQQEEKGIGSWIISRAVQVEIQVATSPFDDSDTLGLTPPDGLVYSYMDTAPDIGKSDEYGSAYYTPSSHGIEYEQFVPSKQELDAMGGIYYYVRGIFYVPDDENPSELHPYSSETLTIAFRNGDVSKNEVKKIAVKSDIPYVQFLQYVPIQWQASDYDEYYEVARHIEAEEMNFSIEHDGQYLLPYEDHIKQYGWTREQYQALLDEMLPPGAVIHYVKAKPGFWDEFFGLLEDIYSGVSNAYVNAKASVVSLVDYIPLIGDDARGLLKKAAAYAVDYGLMSIGLPPSLPNIDQLAQGGMDYLVKVAVDEALRCAGVPADSAAAEEITEEVRQRVTAGLTEELEKAVLSQQQNPLHATFLRLDTKKLYAPAYVDVFVCNYSKTRTTRAGQLFFSSGNGFDVYKTQCLTIPSLKPGEHTTVRMYLDHYRNKYDGYNQFFDEKYNGTSGKPYKMIVYTYFELPNANIAAKEQGLEAAPLPYVTEFIYDHDAYSYRYERDFVPAQAIYESDNAPNTHDFLD